MHFTSGFLAGVVFSALRVVSAQSVSETVREAAIDLLDASHILHFLNIVDALGHVSVRNPDNATEFFMTFAIAPAQATSQSIVKHHVALTIFQIYKKFPDVHAVVHAHTPAVLPFANVRNVPLVALMSTAPSVGPAAPIFDFSGLSGQVLQGDTLSDFLVRNELLGDALANTFQTGGDVVLMANHGMAVRGSSIRQVVFSAFYIMENAQVQLQSLTLNGGKAPGSPEPLSAKEITDCQTTAGASLYVTCPPVIYLPMLTFVFFERPTRVESLGETGRPEPAIRKRLAEWGAFGFCLVNR
ncbi:class II aldolase/adducin N-terminal [Mycena pura]|uniref:Class II aldolase/adducin N-terminal n=1 Tax=Mycena pura TaxID=153505 RepID=A0AAD6YJ49_9AGAR|nr:class II aldolase/adducin N-terminal [Mycena pura]